MYSNNIEYNSPYTHILKKDKKSVLQQDKL